MGESMLPVSGAGQPLENAAEPQTLPTASATTRSQLKVVGIAAALGGILFGGTVEYFVGNLLDSTGWFGPTIETLIDEQVANFTSLEDKLAALERSASDPETARLTRELGTLLAAQEQLARRTHVELEQTQQQMNQLREQALLTTGGAGGADFRLANGQSVSVGSRENVFAIQRYHSGGAAVNMNGTASFIRPGDFVEATAGRDTYRVFFKDLPTREDARGGFDIVKIGS